MPTKKSAQHYRRYLDPKVLARIGGLDLRARLIVEGFFCGMHRSPYRGLSIEFAGHRIYTQGDDIRHIDWKVFGRTDKYYIKEYEQETNLELVLVVDASESMRYQSAGAAWSKFDYATSIAAAVAYLALQQRDTVGLALFDNYIRNFLRPSNNAQQWRTLVDALTDGAPVAAAQSDKTHPRRTTSIARVLAELGEMLGHRTLVIFISDLFDDSLIAGGGSQTSGISPDEILNGFKQLRYRRHEIVVFNIWDPAELTLSFRGPTRFAALETGGALLAEPGGIRQRYLDEIQRFQQRMRQGFSHMRIDYSVFDTASALDVALSTYLATRSSRIRQRSSRVMARG